jgi:predicted RNase H-like nuclease (RuvC/YqgF family)
LVLESYSLEKSLTTWRGDVDNENNMNNNQEDDKLRASGGSSLEDLMRRLEKLTTKNNKLRRKAKGKKTKGGSSSSEDEDSSLKEDVSKKGKKGRNNRDKTSYNSMSFNYDNMPSTIAYTSIPIGKALYFDETFYNQWKHCMKTYLYSISPEVWQVVCDVVEFLD